MSDTQVPKVFTAEENARDAAKWRELCEKIRHCLSDDSNGFTSIWGGIENLSAFVQSQSRGFGTVEAHLRWTAPNEIREDLNAVVEYAKATE